MTENSKKVVNDFLWEYANQINDVIEGCEDAASEVYSVDEDEVATLFEQFQTDIRSVCDKYRNLHR